MKLKRNIYEKWTKVKLKKERVLQLKISGEMSYKIIVSWIL